MPRRPSAPKRRPACQLGLATLALLLVSSCAGLRLRPDPIPVEEVIAMTEEGVAPEVIVARLEDSRTVYVLRAREVKDLLERGVAEEVVDWMLETRLRDLERRIRRSYELTVFHGPIFPHYLHVH